MDWHRYEIWGTGPGRSVEIIGYAWGFSLSEAAWDLHSIMKPSAIVWLQVPHA
jgi:hypothetical protein